MNARPKIQDYEISPEILRVESHGQVYKATHKLTGELVTIKKVTADDGVPPTLVREMSVLGKFTKSAYVVNCREVIHEVEDYKPVYYVIYEYLVTDLHSYIAAKPLPSDVVKNLLFKLLQGVDECHSKGVRHRNLNPSNLLVDEERGCLKIGAGIGQSFAFFGEASSIPGGTVSLFYQAPEALLRSTKCRAAVDMWAVGCIFAEMVTGDVLFVGIGDDPKHADKEHLHEIFSRQLGKPTEHEWRGVASLPGWEPYEEWEGEKKKARCYLAGDLPKDLLVAAVSLEQDGADLLSKMLTYDPVKRITAKAAMEHPYFKPTA
ncbi:cyclin-dependent kinase B1-1 isoform X1 [Rosa chinensis]|uniref:cyclin-dependent kinase B1-1 isoform X1 n=1 Tax=Rosa chinensis TaxID=74649 RepID=UPI001AD91A67|nr:cyclin-dependent kinase B1-1 isoform X1 [Rosa chinensis]